MAGLALLAFAATAIGSGLDRIGARNPLVAQLVPAPFAAASLQGKGLFALMSGDTAALAAAARKAVARAPMEPGNTGLLGAALLANGKPDAADRTFRVAGQMGWRDPSTQAYWLQVSLAAGEWDIAAQRADAIFRLDPAQANNAQIVAPFEDDPRGRAALVARIAARPGWTEAYFDPPATMPPERLDRRAAVLAMVGGAKGPGCAIGAPFAARLAAAGRVANAYRTWRGSCPAAGDDLLRDGDFAAASADPEVPFAWRLLPSGSIALGREGAGDGLTVANRAAFPRGFARQLLVLDPGRYRLSWRERGAGGAARVLPAVGCDAARGERLTPVSDGAGSYRAEFTVGAQCAGAWLTLLLADGNGQVQVSGVVLTPL